MGKEIRRALQLSPTPGEKAVAGRKPPLESSLTFLFLDSLHTSLEENCCFFKVFFFFFATVIQKTDIVSFVLRKAIRGVKDRKGNGKMDWREGRRKGEGAMMSRKGYGRKTER